MSGRTARSRRPLQCVVFAIALTVSFVVAAQGVIQKPVRILVGAPPGGTTDTLARAMAAEMAPLIGQPVVVENRAGAGGNIAAEAVARAAPDGTTLLVSFTSHTINATLYPKLAFDPVADFTPITMIATVPSMLVGHPELPPVDLKALIAYAKAQPGKLNFAIGGVGSSVHMASELFKLAADVDIVSVPYKGTAPALTDVLGGQVPLMFASVSNVAQHVKSGKLRAYGVTSDKRLAVWPDVPAIAETLPGFESNAWFGLFGPAKLPRDTLATLAAAAQKAAQSPALKQRLEADGATPVGNDPTAFAAFVRDDVKRWAPAVKRSGATPQ